jgi:branched-chain amino acid transport system substrate-binding protein
MADNMNQVHCGRRRRFGLIAVLALAGMTLAACGSSSPSSNSSAASPIAIGLSVAETGGEAIPSLTTGYEEAVAEANAAGGLDVAGVHHKVDLIILDNRSDPSLMSQQVHTLVLLDHAVALVSGCCDLNVAEAPLANALKVPLVGTDIPTDLMSEVNGAYSWDADVSFSTLATYLPKVIPILGSANKKVALIADNNPQGQAENALYEALAKAAGYTVTEASLVPVGTTDFSSFVNKAKTSDTDNLVVQMGSSDCFALWKQMKALGYQPKTAAANQCGAIPTWSTLGQLGNGAVIGLDWTPTSGLPDATKLAAIFNKSYPDDVVDQEQAVNSYTAMEILFSAIERARSTDPAKINAAIKTTDASFPLGTVKFDSDNNWSGTLFYGQWLNGKVVQVYPEVPGVKAEFPVGGLGQ